MPRAAYPHPGTTPRHLNTAPCYLCPLLQSTVPVVCCCNNNYQYGPAVCTVPTAGLEFNKAIWDRWINWLPWRHNLHTYHLF